MRFVCVQGMLLVCEGLGAISDAISGQVTAHWDVQYAENDL